MDNLPSILSLNTSPVLVLCGTLCGVVLCAEGTLIPKREEISVI